MIQLLWKKFLSLFTKLCIFFPVYPNDLKNFLHMKSPTPKSVVSILIMVKYWKHAMCISVDYCINLMSYSHIIGSCLETMTD